MRCFFLLFLLSVVIVSACTADVEPVPIIRTQAQTPTSLALRPSATPTLFQTTSTQNTALPILTNTPTATPSQTPTRTPRPSPTATATPPTHYALPDWIDDPDVPVLLAGILRENGDLVASLFNLLTNELWDIQNFGNHFSNWARVTWNRSEDGLFIEFSYEPASTVEDATGPLLERIAVPDGEITKWPLRARGEFSHEGRSFFRLIRETGSPIQAFLVESYELGQEPEEGILLADPFAGRYGGWANASWSPDDTFIAVLRIDFSDVPFGRSDYGLTIYTAEGQLFRTYDTVNDLQWSPTGPLQILHSIEPAEELPIPCILDVVSGNDRCFYSLQNWQEERSVENFQYRWSPDSSRISFFTYPEPGVCYFELATEQISCPIKAGDLIMDDYQFLVVAHEWSEDGQYLSVIMNPNGPLSDDASFPYIAVSSIEGNDFRVLGETLASDRPLRLWRPSLEN